MPDTSRTDLSDTDYLSSIEEVLDDARNGRMFVLIDDEDRENEGDLVIPAQMATPDAINFMAKHGRGLICLSLSRKRCEELRLPLMAAHNQSRHSTAFTLSIEAREGVTTGISAADRAHTVAVAIDPGSTREDLATPGHVFPLMAKDGGVLVRAGHTEAAVDLCKLAGLPPVGVISELMNDDGSVMRGPQVMAFARAHKYKMISVADLISYRQARERLVEREGMFEVETPVGPARAFAYSTPFDQVQHLALVFGDISGGENIPVRLHREDLLADVFGARSALNKVYDTFKREGSGVLVYLREGTTGVPGSQLHATSEEVTETAKARKEAWRDVGLGAQILRDLGVSSIRLIASRNRHYVGLSGFGIEISETLRNDV